MTAHIQVISILSKGVWILTPFDAGQHLHGHHMKPPMHSRIISSEIISYLGCSLVVDQNVSHQHSRSRFVSEKTGAPAALEKDGANDAE